MLLLAHCSRPADELRHEAPDLPAGIVANDAEWEILAKNYIYTDGPVTDADGNFYFADVISRTIYKIDPEGEQTIFDDGTAMTMGMVISEDNVMYGCRNLDAQIVRYNWDGSYEKLAEGTLTPNPGAEARLIPGEFCNDLAVNTDGGVWFTERPNNRVWYISPGGDTRVVAEGFRPNGVQVSLDKKMLYVGDSESPVMHAFRIGKNGSLKEIPGFFEPLVMPKRRDPKRIRPGTNGMTMDDKGRLFVSTFMGIQVFDTQGILLGIIKQPKGGYVSNLELGGADGRWLYVTGSSLLARIRVQCRGMKEWDSTVVHSAE